MKKTSIIKTKYSPLQKKYIRLKLYHLLFLLIIFATVLSILKSFVNIYELKTEKNMLIESKKNLDGEINTLSKQLKESNKNKYIEEQARNRFNLTYPRETVYRSRTNSGQSTKIRKNTNANRDAGQYEADVKISRKIKIGFLSFVNYIKEQYSKCVVHIRGDTKNRKQK